MRLLDPKSPCRLPKLCAPRATTRSLNLLWPLLRTFPQPAGLDQGRPPNDTVSCISAYTRDPRWGLGLQHFLLVLSTLLSRVIARSLLQKTRAVDVPLSPAPLVCAVAPATPPPPPGRPRPGLSSCPAFSPGLGLAHPQAACTSSSTGCRMSKPQGPASHHVSNALPLSLAESPPAPWPPRSLRGRLFFRG